MTDVRDVGDWRIAEISISTPEGTPAAGTVTLSVVRGDDTVIASVPMAAGSPTATSTPWTSDPYELTVSGEWIERFTITGDGKGKARQVFYVLDDPGTVPTGELVYATTADYMAAVHEAPTGVNLRRALAAATRALSTALLTAVYETNTVTLLPTDTAVVGAIRDAVVEQARWAIEQGDPYGLGVDVYQNASIGSLSLGRGSNGGSADPPGRRSPEALAILARAGLTGNPPQTEVYWW